ncbi:TPA: type I toxin-antitoxin system Ibs family toxin [Citrobacter braakii]|nr:MULTISPECIES: type I toxin-antitoxin system Ibs family toxin [Citrobacter]MDM3338884.1 type I toxin-antitoxin system Ibs family toxin [Citrobacter sp. Cb043]HEB0893540.1 type I toxin-antitoxin system Ibs family toxin [Citrobacter braakii]
MMKQVIILVILLVISLLAY